MAERGIAVRYEAIQIRISGAELSKHARRYIRVVQPRSLLDIGESLSIFPTTGIYVLEKCGGFVGW
jgi:hypothetical protein